MKKKSLMLLVAGMVLLALFVPAVSAADYPDIAQFIAYYNPEKLSGAEASPDAGITYYNPEAASSITRAVPRSIDPDDWPQFMQNVKNTGYSSCDSIPNDNSSVTYNNSLDDIIGTINPVVVGNKILVMTGYAGFEEPTGLTQVNLTCIDRDTMNIDWQYPLPRTTESRGYYSNSWSSAATDGTYAYASSDNKTVCVRISDGQWMWTFTMEYDNCDGSPTVTDDYVFCSDWGNGDGSIGGNYYCLNKTDGQEIWRFNNADTQNYDYGYSQGTPAYEKDGDSEYIYVTGYSYDYPDSDGYLYKVNVTAGGTEEWGIKHSNGYDGFCGSASISGRYVYVTSYNFVGDGQLFKFRKSNGNLVDSVDIERSDATPSIDEENGLIYVSGGWDGGIYGSAAPGVRCYDTSLNLVWSRLNESMGGFTCSVAIGEEDDDGDRLVFVGKETGYNSYPSYCYNKIYALYANNGTTKWFYDAGGATAAIANDEIYSVDNNGNLYIFS